MNLQDTYKLRFDDPDFKGRVTAAVSRTCQNILNEGTDAPNHANRATWCNFALQNTQGVAEQAMWTVVSDPSIQATGSTSDDTTIQSVMDAYCVSQIPVAAA
jgi:hypothetical protein